jgi:hypothetical protein
MAFSQMERRRIRSDALTTHLLAEGDTEAQAEIVHPDGMATTEVLPTPTTATTATAVMTATCSAHCHVSVKADADRGTNPTYSVSSLSSVNPCKRLLTIKSSVMCTEQEETPAFNLKRELPSAWPL